MRNRMICLASLVILSSSVGVATAKLTSPTVRTAAVRRLPLLRDRNLGRATAAIEIFAPSYKPEPIGTPGPKQVAIKAKRELLKVAISFERYRIAQRKFPLKLHDQIEVLAVRHSDAGWSLHSKLEISGVETARV